MFFIVGNFFNKHPNKPITQAEELKKILERRNIRVFFASHYISRILRLLHTLFNLFYYRKEYNIVNIQFYGGLALILEDLTSRLAKMLRKKIIFTLHGGSIPTKIKQNEKWYKRVLFRGDVITCPSNYMIDHLKPFGFNLILIENSLPLNEYKFHKKDIFRPHILWMRAFHPIYNPEMALNVIKILEKQIPGIRLFMAGVDLGYFKKIEELTHEMGLDDVVIFLGILNNETKNFIAEKCDIYLCTNRIDNTPVTFLEMMALGLPIISTNVGGVPYMVEHKKEALLVESEDIHAMARAIEKLISEPSLGKRLVENGKILVKYYDEEIVASKWVNLIQELI